MCHFDHWEKSYLFNILHMKDFSRSLSRPRGGARNDSLLGLFSNPSMMFEYNKLQSLLFLIKTKIHS